MKIGFVSFIMSSIAMQEALLKAGHEIVIFMGGLYNQDLEDESGLAEKYPGQVTISNEGQHYKHHFENLEAPIPPSSITEEIKADLAKFANQVELVIFDYNGPWVVHHANYLRDYNRLTGAAKICVAGPTDFTNRLELDREFGKVYAEEYGFSTDIRHKWVTNKEEALEYLEANPDTNFLLKGTVETAMPMTRADCADILTADPYDFFGKEKGVFMEERIEGQEFSFDAWFNGEEFYSHVFVNREYKGAQNNLRGGVFTGESGTAGQMIPMDEIPTFMSGFFEFMKPHLVQAGYRGFFGVNTITYWDTVQDGWVSANDDVVMAMHKVKKVHFLEFTTRFGYPTEHILTHLVDYDEFVQWVTGYNPVMPLPSDGPSVSVAFSCFWENKKYRPLIHGVDTLHRDIGVGLFDARYDEDGNLRVCEFDRAIILSAFAPTFKEARAFLYNEAHKVQIWGHTYRDDIGEEFTFPGYDHGLVPYLQDLFDDVEETISA